MLLGYRTPAEFARPMRPEEEMGQTNATDTEATKS